MMLPRHASRGKPGIYAESGRHASYIHESERERER